MAGLELSFYVSLLFVLFTAVFLPFGHLVSSRFASCASEELKFVFSFGISILLYSVLVICGVLAGLSNVSIAVVVYSVVVMSLTIWVMQGRWRELIRKDVISCFVIMFLYLLFCTISAAFPTGDLREISVVTSMRLLDLPIDNLIPYNFSRYIVERINPTSLEVVPTWFAVDRGPLAGVVNALIFIMLGIKDAGQWVETPAGPFFVYQALMTYLNLLSLVAMWFIARHLCGRKAAIIGALLLLTTYFYFSNVMFSWPKFFMAYYVLCATVAWQMKCREWVSGVFFAGALLSHDSALFSIVAFFAMFLVVHLWQFRRSPLGSNGSLISVVKLCLWFILTVSPWWFYKGVMAPSSNRLVYFQLFGPEEVKANRNSLIESARGYVAKHGVRGVAEIRARNFSYPFSLENIASDIVSRIENPYSLVVKASILAPKKLVYGLGFPVFLLFLVFPLIALRDNAIRTLLPLFIVAFGGYVVASIVLGNPSTETPNTVSHHWAYPAFIVSAMIAGRVVASSGLWATALLVVGVASNVLIGICAYYIRSNAAPLFYASKAYIYWQMGVFILLLVTHFVLLVGNNQEIRLITKAK